MDEIKIVVAMSKTKPDYRPLAIELLDEIRRFYKDPEHEKAFQEWKAKRKGA